MYVLVFIVCLALFERTPNLPLVLLRLSFFATHAPNILIESARSAQLALAGRQATRFFMDMFIELLRN